MMMMCLIMVNYDEIAYLLMILVFTYNNNLV